MTEKQFEEEEEIDISQKRIFHEHLFVAYVNKNIPCVTSRNRVLTVLDKKIELFVSKFFHRLREALLR